jgi:hypothetical protein
LKVKTAWKDYVFTAGGNELLDFQIEYIEFCRNGPPLKVITSATHENLEVKTAWKDYIYTVQVVMSCWLFFTVIMVAAYTGNLFSFITFPSLLAPIDSLQV